MLCSSPPPQAVARPSGVMEAPAPWRVLEFYSGIGGMVVSSTLALFPDSPHDLSNLVAARVSAPYSFCSQRYSLMALARGRRLWRPSTSTTSPTTSTSTTSATAPARYASLVRGFAILKPIRNVLRGATVSINGSVDYPRPNAKKKCSCDDHLKIQNLGCAA